MQSTSQTCKVNVDPFGSLILEEKATDIEFKESGNPVLCAEKWNKVKKSKAALVAVLAVFKLCRKRCCGYHRVFKFYNTSQVRGKGPSRTMGRGILRLFGASTPKYWKHEFSFAAFTYLFQFVFIQVWTLNAAILYLYFLYLVVLVDSYSIRDMSFMTIVVASGVHGILKTL